MPETLKRSMRTSALTTHYVTSVMGVGVLVVPSLAWAATGPLSLIAWAILILYSFPFALIFAKLSTMFPTAKGVAQFAEAAFGSLVGRITAVFLLITLLVANPVLGLAAGRYLVGAVAPDASNRTVLVVGAAIIVGCIALNLFGIRVSSGVQMTVLAIVTIMLLIVVLMVLPKGDYSALSPVAPDGWLPLGTALLICFFGFIGWENSAPVAEEVHDPERTFPRAIFCAVTVVGILYFCMALAVAVTLPRDIDTEAGLTGFVNILNTATGSSLATAGSIVAGVLMVLTTNAWCLGTSRVVFALARDGVLPSRLQAVSRRTSVPRNAVLALVPGYGIPVVALVLMDSDESTLIKASSAAFLIVFLVAFVSGVRLIRTGAMRYVTIVVSIITAAMLPFFGISVLYALGMLAVTLVIVWLIGRRAAESGRSPHVGG